jgi:hypothetical protein
MGADGWDWFLKVPGFLLSLFLVLVAFSILKSKKAAFLFTRPPARLHRFLGLAYAGLLMPVSLAMILGGSTSGRLERFLLDILLGFTGTALAVTAATGFPAHKDSRVKRKNVANGFVSGPLDEEATVSRGEMIEHAFYQGVNLVQIMFLWAAAGSPGMVERSVGLEALHLGLFGQSVSLLWLDSAVAFLLLLGVTSPWLIRDRFPTNSFSANYSDSVEGKGQWTVTKFLYFIKKWEYVFYKHFLLHGLNVSVAVQFALSRQSGFAPSLPESKQFQLYWVGLNLSYTMEFFLQTLVRRKAITQRTMLQLQGVLMTASALCVWGVLSHVRLLAALLSLVANFGNRKHDVLNTLFVALVIGSTVVLDVPLASIMCFPEL